MKALLTKRLFRSLWRTKLRLVAVVLIIMVGVMSGIAFGHYANVATNTYSNIYEDSENGVNLADIWIENPRTVWDLEESENLCCLLYTSPSPRDAHESRMPSSA